MAWTSDDWEPWVIFLASLVTTSALTALFCWRRSRRRNHRRFNQVDITAGNGDSPHRSDVKHAFMSNNGQSRSTSHSAPALLPKSAIRLRTRLIDGRFGHCYNAMITNHNQDSILYARAVRVQQLETTSDSYTEVGQTMLGSAVQALRESLLRTGEFPA